jgi:Arc/MetJ-type ribon-helix-helix transcriptional regulator
MPVRNRAARTGTTEKVSISIDRSDLAAMRKRARRLYHGNLSAVVAEGLRRVREEEGREALLEWLGEAAEATPSELQAVRDEWRSAVPRRAARRRA